MTDIEYLLLTSIMPVGMLVVAALLFYFTKEGPDRPRPGE